MQYLLIGNPNVGKTTLFNNLTGSHAQVGNWSGITVDKKAGTIKETADILLDLPGTYSVTPNSEDEGVVTYALMNESFEGIFNIIDAGHLKRNLQLTIQILETGKPVRIALNMMDELAKKGLKIDPKVLARKLGVPVVPMIARKGESTDHLLSAPAETLQTEAGRIDYGHIIEGAIAAMEKLLQNMDNQLSHRWLAIQILEGNQGVHQALEPGLAQELTRISERTEADVIQAGQAMSLKGAIFNRRRELIADIYGTAITRDASLPAKGQFTALDRWLTHPVIGLFIFFFVMLFVYALTFDFLGTVLSDGFESLFSGTLLPALQTLASRGGIREGSFLSGAIFDGLLAGVAGIIVFLPQILILFFCLSVMEGTGYMARVAIVMDSLFSRFGLNGKAIVPMVTGFGCNVPAIMATRTIADKSERLKTIAIIPFMSCSARLPVYVMFVGLFFPRHQVPAIMALYLMGLVVALAGAKIMSLSIFKKAEEHFILEVPPYRLPQFKNTFVQAWKKAINFFIKAGTFIVAGSLIMWFLQFAGPQGLNVDSEQSFLAYFAGLAAPIFAPIGLGTWQLVSTLVVGFFAKELVASSMLVIYGSQAALQHSLTVAQAASFLVFTLLYVPCLATVGVMHRETKSYKATSLIIISGLAAAYLLSFVTYHLFL